MLSEHQRGLPGHAEHPLILKEPPGLLPFSVTSSFSFYLSLLLGYNDLRPHELQAQLSHQNSPNLSLDIVFPACPSLWSFMPCTEEWAFGNVSACDSRTVAILPSRGHLVMCGDMFWSSQLRTCYWHVMHRAQ